MNYVIASISKCEEYGIGLLGRRHNEDMVILNYRDVGNVPGKTLEEKAACLDGEVVDYEQAMHIAHIENFTI